ncbi:MAG TPA: hypothetical protein VEN81_09795 [Planctomycetota bacterium]|nr:hypothetical protein [Planctomycetota bacterium]
MKFKPVWIAMIVAFLATYALAQTVVPAGAPAAAPAAATTSTTAAILLAALNGAIVGFLGWLSQRKQPDGTLEKFDPVQLMITVLVGAGVGAIAAWRGKSFNDVETWIQNSGYVTLAEIALKAIWRNGSVTVAGILGALKAGGSNPPSASTGQTPPATPKP